MANAKNKNKNKAAKEQPAETTMTPEELIASSGVTLETLESTPERVLKIMLAVVANPGLRAAMMKIGFDDVQQQRGVRILQQLCLLPAEEALPDDAMTAAYVEIDNGDEELFEVIDATFEFNYPAQHRFVRQGIGPTKGFQAVIHTELAATRLDEMWDGSAREETREDDHAALALLAKRGYPRERILKLIELAKLARKLEPMVQTNGEEREAERLRHLIELRKFYLEWSRMARVKIRRREYLIRMGLASPRQKAPEEPVAEQPAPTDLSGGASD